MNSKEALKRIYNDAISMNEIEEDVKEIKNDYNLIKQDLDRLEQLEKELKQTKLNFRNSQIHSKNCYKKLKEKYEQLEKDYDELFDYHALLTIKLEQLEKENQELKETLNKTRKMGLEIIEEKEQLSNELHKLNCYRNIELNEITKLKKAIEILKNKIVNIHKLLTTTLIVYNNLALLLGYDKLTQEEYELLKNVMEE